ncbi:hypothetical protein ABW19_dt0204966 [Dactylella cylindrospora]|nr:hypothetical protein ABW19_dt0204966 [Dactylella cylindrospora]
MPQRPVTVIDMYKSSVEEMAGIMRGQPLAVKFPDGSEGSLPNISRALKPSILGGLGTYAGFAMGGTAAGVVTGSMAGGRAKSKIESEHPESARRIRACERKFMVEGLRTFVDILSQKVEENSDPDVMVLNLRRFPPFPKERNDNWESGK